AALVDEDVGGVAPAHQVLARARVAGDDDAPAAPLEVEAERRLDRVVLDEKRAHLDAAHVHEPALLDLRHADPGRLALAHVGAAHLDVPAEVVEELLDLPAGAGGTPD